MSLDALATLRDELDSRYRKLEDLRKQIDAFAAQDVVLLNDVFDKAVEAFDDREKAAIWFLTPIVALAGKRPIDAMQLGPNWVNEVMHSIGVIKYGAPG